MAKMTKKQKMQNLVTFLAAAAIYDPAVDFVCDIVECENCPYYKPVPDDEMPDYKECEGKLRKLRDTIEDIEREMSKLQELRGALADIEKEAK